MTPRLANASIASFASFLALGAAFALSLGAASCGPSRHGGAGPAPDAADAGGAVDSSEIADQFGEEPPGEPDASADAADTGDAPAESAPYPAPHAAPPQVLNSGGPVMTAPKVLPIFFAGDGLQGQLESFLTSLAGSSYWHEVTAEYGVGPLKVLSPITVNEPAPATISDAEIQDWIYARLAGPDPGWPIPDANTIFLVMYPDATTVTANFGAGQVEMGCTSFGGYHEESTPGGEDAGVDASPLPDAEPPLDATSPGDGSSPTEAGGAEAGPADGGGGLESGSPVSTDSGINSTFIYAVIPRCAVFGNLVGIDGTTGAISHELVEASTDPFDVTNPAYISVDDDHLIWDYSPLGELGDMCAYEPQSFQPLVAGSMVQRIWSNKAALAGTDPCVPPLPSLAYYNTTPVLPATVTISSSGQTYRTRGLKIPVGQTAMMTLQFFSTEATGPWTVYPEDTSQAFNGPQLLSFNPSQITGQNGDVVTVAVTAVAAGPYGGSEFLLQSLQNNDDSYINYWFGFIQN